MNDLTKKALSVSQFVDLIKTTLQSVVGDIAVFGEVSEFQRRSSGSLVFFSLKDESSYIRCFMMDYELKTDITDGMEIKVVGYPSLFKKNGGFHIRVRSIELMGEGALRKQLELTKKKLEAEGLFAQERKRKLPRFPLRIGIITSEDAAALTDIKRVVQNRWPLAMLQLVPAQVQGAPAVNQILKALDVMERQVNPEVIILARGGGSLEDLQAFNDERIARRIFSSSIPIVTGIGHERDVTIADLVADVRGATPSNAAELVVPDVRDVLFQIETMTDGLSEKMNSRITDFSHGITSHATSMHRAISFYFDFVKKNIHSVASFGKQITERIMKMNNDCVLLERRLGLRMQTTSSVFGTKAASLHALILSYSPQSILRRGYTVTRKNGAVIRSSKALKKHDILQTTFADGDITSSVE